MVEVAGLSPIDRIRQALPDEAQRARFDRGLDALADVMVEALATGVSVTPAFEPRIHDQNLVEIHVTARRTVR